MNFDLNIENYKEDELRDIFGLTSPYQVSSIRASELRLRENIMSDQKVDKHIKTQTLDFLQKARQILSIALNTDTKELKSSALTAAGDTFIIQPPVTPYTNSLPSEFYPGTINPLKRRTLRQSLNIDTRFRDNYQTTESTNFHLDLPTNFNKIMTMQVTAFEFPISYYVVSKRQGTNFFAVTVDGVSSIIVVPDGNYSAAAIVTLLNALNSGVSFIWHQEPDGSGTGQLTMTASGSALHLTLSFDTDIQGNVDQSPLQLKLGWMLGFRQPEYTGDSLYLSEGVVDLTGPKYIYLAVDDYNNNVNNGFYSAFNASILNNNILARIALQPTASVHAIDYTNETVITSGSNMVANPRQYFGPVDIRKLHIQLLDEYGRQIRLNSMDYSFCLTMQSVYDL